MKDQKEENLKLRNASFILGYDGNAFQTEKQSQFSSKNDKCEQRIVDINRNTNIKLGNQGNTYESTNKKEFTSKQTEQYRVG